MVEGPAARDLDPFAAVALPTEATEGDGSVGSAGREPGSSVGKHDGRDGACVVVEGCEPLVAQLQRAKTEERRAMLRDRDNYKERQLIASTSTV